MLYLMLISALETLLKGVDKLRFLIEMFEDIVSAAVQMLILLFFITLVFIVFSGILWTRSIRKQK